MIVSSLLFIVICIVSGLMCGVAMSYGKDQEFREEERMLKQMREDIDAGRL